MVDVDFEQVGVLLVSARDFNQQGDLAGVAGMAQQAFESAMIALTEDVNGVDPGSHATRHSWAKDLMSSHQDKIDFLWGVRNVDLYGNPQLNQPKRELSKEDVAEALDTDEAIIGAIKKPLSSRQRPINFHQIVYYDVIFTLVEERRAVGCR